MSLRTRYMKMPSDKMKDNLVPIIRARKSNLNKSGGDLLQLMLNAEAEYDTDVDVQKLTARYDHEAFEETGIEDKPSPRGKRRMTTMEIQANAVTFLVAGFETTAITLACTTFLLAKHQDVQDKLRAEIMKKGDLSYENISSLRYLDQVISESMRLYPAIVGFVTRTCKSDYHYGSLKIPQGLTVLVPTYQLHHDPRHWPDPERFDPERFSPENRHEIQPMAYQAFGNGPRNCGAMRFAQLSLQTTLAKLISNYKITLDERHQSGGLKLGSTFTLSFPNEGVWLRIADI